MLITVEGVDAAGKGTQSRLLAKALEASTFTIFELSFPDYSTPLGELIRAELHRKLNVPRPRQYMQMMMAANRWECLPTIAFDNNNGVTVVNRYTESNLAYGLANGLDLAWLREIERGLPVADIVIEIDVDPEKVLSRFKRVKDMNEEDVQYQKRTRAAYATVSEGDRRWHRVDGMGTIEEIHERILSLEPIARLLQV